MAKSVSTSLSVMMFLQFFIWGSWYVTAANYVLSLGWSAEDVGTVYSLCPIAAVISPLFLGCFADRFFAAQRLMGVLHLLGGGLLILLPPMMGEGTDTGWTSSFTWVLYIYALCYMPTLGLANTIAFHHLADQAKQFPLIRVFGTLGWIAAGILVSKVMEADQKPSQFYVAAGASLLLGVYCFALPHTPPDKEKKVSAAEALGLGALGLLRRPAFLIFMACSFLICIPLQGYYAFAQVYVGDSGFENPAYYMSYGQWAEVLFMLAMPAMFARFGVKWMLAVGMLAWVLRYGLFSVAAGDEPVKYMVMGGILLHGICYDFFFVTGQIYVDKVAPKAIRGQAQGFLVLITLGLGLWVGAIASGALVKEYSPANDQILRSQAADLTPRIDELTARDVRSAAEDTELEQISAERRQKLRDAQPDWGTIWMWPAWGAGAILVLFILLFRYRPE